MPKKKIDRINNEKKIIMDREREANELLKKTSDDRDKFQKKANQNENSIKEKIRYIDNINKVVNEKNNEIEKLKSKFLLIIKKFQDSKKKSKKRNKL